LAKHITNNDIELEAKIRRDITLITPINTGDLRAIRVNTLIATALIEYL